jgi:SAM dependent carboxyl methyltransferase
MKPTAQPQAASTERMIDYDRNSFMQDQMVLSKEDQVAALVREIGPIDPEFVLVDYGCGPAHSALDAVRPAVDAYRQISPAGRMVVRHMDQPGNDWNALLALVFGKDGYQHHGSSIRTEMAAGSFHSVMAAPRSVALGTCFAASHWLSRSISIHSPGTVWFADLKGKARAEVAALARADWTQFLRCRAQELRRGGFLFVSTLGSVPDKAERNGIRASARKLYRAIHDVVHQMVADGLLKASALDSFLFSLWFPTAEEARTPIEVEPDLAEAFNIIEASVRPAAVNPQDVYVHEIGDPATYANLYAGYVRGFGESSLRMHLFGPAAQDAAETDALTEAFFQRLTNYYQAEPGRHASETMIITLILHRK